MMKRILVASLLALVLLARCSKENMETIDSVDLMEVCSVTPRIIGSNWVLPLAIDGSGHDKVILRHTQALRTMARRGNTTPLYNELCEYNRENGVQVLKTGHKSDINRIGFATQLRVEHYIIAMYHPNNYPDHFIIYNELTKDWTRYAEGNSPEVYLTGNGD